MNGRYLLDTNIVIALFNEDVSVRARMGQEIEMFVPAVVLGELYFGASKSGRANENLARVSELASTTQILSCNARTARSYGQLKTDLRAKGRMIPENDLWVAATALQHDLTLVSRDGHFADIPRLHLESW